MSSVVISGDTSGSVTLQAPATAGSTTLTLPATSGTVLTTASGQWITTGSDIYYNTGNVGIGTASPSTKLDVNGSVTISGTNGAVNSPVFQAYPIYSGAYSPGTSPALWQSASGVLSISTNASERMRIDSSGYVTNGANGNSAGLVQGYQYYRLNSGYAGSNVNTAQSLFGVGVTLVGSTVYEFEISVGLVKTAGVTSHTISLGFGGTATLNNIGYNVIGDINATGTIGAANLVVYYYTTASASQATTSAGTASVTSVIIAKGTVSVNAGGTFIPQYTLSAAPGGAYTTQIGSYIKIAPLSASGSNTSIGTWA